MSSDPDQVVLREEATTDDIPFSCWTRTKLKTDWQLLSTPPASGLNQTGGYQRHTRRVVNQKSRFASALAGPPSRNVLH
jgi:hypothetical protein